MTQTTQYDNPNDIDSFSVLKIKAVSGNLSPSIYANGRNQLPIQITVKVLDKEGRPLKFSKETWISILNLRFAENDTKLNRKGSSGWCFTEVENEYSKEIQSGSHRSKRFLSGEDGTAIIILYVYTDDINTKRIAVSVDTDNGKHFTTADNRPGDDAKMAVKINSHPKINYSNRNNICITEGSFDNISTNLGFTKRLLQKITQNFFPFTDYYNGICKRKLVEIRPAIHVQEQTFKNHQIIYSIVTNEDVGTEKIRWKQGVFSAEEDCFSAIKGPDYPCAVIGRGSDRDNYEINFWYNCNNQVNIDGHLYIDSSELLYDRKIRFCPYVAENYSNNKNDDIPKLLLYKFIVPEEKFAQYGWHDVVRNPTVNVTDFYGNTGTFQLTFNDTDHFNIPGIV